MSTAPIFEVPAGACDCHIHVYGDPGRYRWAPYDDRGPPDGPLEDYIAVRDRLGLSRTVIVQTPYYGDDNTCVVDMIERLGPHARGIAVVAPTVTEDALAALHTGGVRGLRFGIELARGMRPDALEDVAAKIAPFGWHIQYRSTERDLPDLADRLGRLPVPICIDHIGSIPPETGVAHPAFKALLRLVDRGRCWVKLSAPYQLSTSGAPAYADYRPQARALVAAAPERMVWGTNWPHPRVTAKPDDGDLLNVLADWAEDASTRVAILVDNPAKLYGFS
ncbi:MAG: amidohydrolase family protein [Alphaproteobacteria bacterium]|nr:amidohydrolase family protein [Alphaproteobacteria bacterium]